MLNNESWIALVLEKDFIRRHELLEAFMANLDSISIRELVSEAGRAESEEGQLAGEIPPHPWAASGHTPSPEVFSEIAEFGRFVLFPNFLRITWHTPPVPAFETVHGPLDTSSENVRVMHDDVERR